MLVAHDSVLAMRPSTSNLQNHRPTGKVGKTATIMITETIIEKKEGIFRDLMPTSCPIHQVLVIRTELMIGMVTLRGMPMSETVGTVAVSS